MSTLSPVTYQQKAHDEHKKKQQSTEVRVPQEKPTSSQGHGDLPENEFDLDEGMKEFEFCSMQSIEQSARFRLLHLRDEEVPEFRALKMIPAFDHDIPSDIFKVRKNSSKIISFLFLLVHNF